jgi:hypothetical protein
MFLNRDFCLLGIEGGIIHVPALGYLLSFPVHIATATSHFILANMAIDWSGTRKSIVKINYCLEIILRRKHPA